MAERAGWCGPRVLPDGGAVAVAPGERAPLGSSESERSWTITVPASPQGIATAVSHLSVAHRTTGPERSHPARRRFPPRVAVGETHIPAAIRTATPDTGIVFRLPPVVEQLYVAAPLAYYLGAELRVEAGAQPELAAPSIDMSHPLPAPPTFKDEVARLLRRCFLLDALIRDLPGDRLTTREGLLKTLPVRPADLRAAGPVQRLRAYLDVTALDDHLPQWHLATYVGSNPAHVRSLPHLLAVMSLVYPAEASGLGRRERLRRSLDGSYRSQTEVASVDVVAPTLAEGDLHAWLADGTPIQAYKTTHSAYEHGMARQNHLEGDPEVVVVVNEEAMASERAVADIYENCTDHGPVSTRVREAVRTDELAAILSRPIDFLHYIGHCEVDGLRCPDGHLAIADLEDVRARTFFLNACGSFHEGLALIERGSTAGAVTLSAVLDDQAATVGTTFAQLLVGGFSVAAALDLARRRILMGTDYAVVGDGTAAAIIRDPPPAVLDVATVEDGSYVVCHRISTPRNPGASYPHPFHQGRRLACERVRTRLNRTELQRILRQRSLPVHMDDKFHWSGELADRLSDH